MEKIKINELDNLFATTKELASWTYLDAAIDHIPMELYEMINWKDLTNQTQAIKIDLLHHINSNSENIELFHKFYKQATEQLEKNKLEFITSEFTVKNNMENDKLFTVSTFDRFENREKTIEFASVKDTARYIDKFLDFSAKNTYILLDLKTGEVRDINNPADQQMIISDFWAKELSQRTDLSYGLSMTQIDEKQAEHYRNYELAGNNSINEKIAEENKIELLGKKVYDFYESPDQIVTWDFKSEIGFDTLKAAIEISKMTEELKNAAVSYSISSDYPPYHPIREDYIKGDIGQNIYSAKLEKYLLIEEPLYIQYMNSLEKCLKENNIDFQKLPKIDFFIAEPFTQLVNNLKQNFSEEINEIDLNNFINQNQEIIENQENNIERYQTVAGSLSDASQSSVDRISTVDLIKLKALKEYNVSDHMRADNFSTIRLLREDIDKIEVILSNRNINNQTPTIMDKEQNQEKQERELKVGNLASVKTDDGLFKGNIEAINGNDVTLKNLEGKTFHTTKDDVYMFFPGQKYDISEIKPLFEKKPGGVEFNNLSKEDVSQLLRGNMTKTMFTGVSQKEGKAGQEYSFKQRPEFNSETKQLELKPHFKNDRLILDDQLKVFGQQITPEQLKSLEEGKAIVVERSSTQTGKDYSAKFHYDTDLNDVIFDKFVDASTVLKQEKAEKIQPQDKVGYEDWLKNDVGMFDNATKVNIHQLNKVGVVLDTYKLEEFLTDFGLEQDAIDKVSSVSDWLSKDGEVTNLKEDILNTINSSAEKVDLFKEKFHSVGEQSTQQMKR